MIIKSHIRGGFRAAAGYLKDQGENELTRLVAMSDPHVRTLDQAFSAMWAIAEGSKVKKPLHHVSINPRKEERLTDLEVEQVCARLEERYGYRAGEHQKVIVEHIKDGRQHFHVMWNRVNRITGKPHYPYLHKKHSIAVARDMEQELGLRSPFVGRRLPEDMMPPRAMTTVPPVRHWQAVIIRPVRPSQYIIATEAAWQNLVSPAIKPSAVPIGTIQTSDATAAMEKERYLDYLAAKAGRMTWRQFFLRWGIHSTGASKPNQQR